MNEFEHNWKPFKEIEEIKEGEEIDWSKEQDEPTQKELTQEDLHKKINEVEEVLGPNGVIAQLEVFGDPEQCKQMRKASEELLETYKKMLTERTRKDQEQK